MIAPAIWSSMLSWSTPAVLFVLLNVAIATIFFSNSQKHKPKQPHYPLTRTPSLYETFKSFNLYRQNTQDLTHSAINPLPHEPEPHQLTRTSSLLDTLKSFNPYHQKHPHPRPDHQPTTLSTLTPPTHPPPHPSWKLSNPSLSTVKTPKI
ncbi:hypothetical protein AAC387_Pa02g2764 [Persea americana]